VINIPEWITAGTAMLAVSGGLLGVYTTTQSRIDISEERLNSTIEAIGRVADGQIAILGHVKGLNDKVVRSEVSAEYLAKGQDRLTDNLAELTGEIRQLNKVVLSLRREEP
jgi:hypothetical protein